MKHHPAAFINAIAEEGTKEEAVQYLQKIWNENCELRAAGKELCGAIDEVICWYSSGFAPQSQANAYARAQRAKAAFNSLNEQTGLKDK